MEDYYIVICPSCKDSIIIYKNELNCRIFRHAVYKNMQPINHTSKDDCDKMLVSGIIYGCASPFRIEGDKDNITAVVCDYI